jgi:hypothetical protein
MTSFYPKCITDPVDKLCEELEKHFPGILKKKYDQNNINAWNEDFSMIKQRMEMGLYMELIKAGFSDQIR